MAALPSSSGGLIDQIDSYVVFLGKKNASAYTIRNYNHHLRIFASFISKKVLISLNEVEHRHIISFKSYLKKQKFSPQTQFSYLSAVRSFLKWAAQNNVEALDPTLVILPRIKPKAQAFIRGNEIDKILSSVNTSRIIGKRDKAILEVLFATGLKVSELVNLNVNDIDFDNKKIQVQGKRNRAVVISTRAMYHILEYMNARREEAGALFISYKGKGSSLHNRMTPRSVQRLVQKYVKRAGVAVVVTPSVLRRSFAADLLRAGESLSNVQKMLGNQYNSGVSKDRSIIL
jgi:site-specific recombinase XerD